MRWEKIETQVEGAASSYDFSSGPGKRWGHTCNAIKGGKFLYVFGGYGKDNCQTNLIHVFDTGGYFGIFLSNIFNAPLLLFDEMCHKDWIFIIQFVHA